MDLEESHYEEVYQVLFTNPFGLEFQALFNKCKSFPEQTDLSRCVHRAGQQGNVVKKNGIYKLTTEKYKEMSGGQEPPVEEEKLDPITEAIKELVAKDPSIPKLPEQPVAEPESKPKPTRVIRSAIQRTEVKPITNKPPLEAMPFGDLQHTKTMGGIALALYKARDITMGLSMDDLIEWTGGTKMSIYQTLPKLIARQYVVREGVSHSRHVRYRWSGNFRYPFAKWEKEDDALLKYPSLLAFENRGDHTTRTVTVPPDQVSPTDVDQERPSGDMAVSVSDKQCELPDLSVGFAQWGPRIPASPALTRTYIDLQLKSLQAQADVLLHLREHMLAEAE